MKYMDSKEVEDFVADKDAAKTAVHKYGDGKGDAPLRDH